MNQVTSPLPLLLLRLPFSRKGFYISMRQILKQALSETRLSAGCHSRIVISLLVFSFLRNTENYNSILVVRYPLSPQVA